MNKPTKEQIQWFWEQCGFAKVGAIWAVSQEEAKKPTSNRNKFNWFQMLPPIDLNNLFKYAVPKWVESFPHSGGNQVAYRIFTPLFEVLAEQDFQKDLADLDKKFALALFWAIYKALGGVVTQETKTQDGK